MTDKNLTHLYFLLDRSGSMQSIRDDIVGGFDAFIADQKREPGECRVSLSQFDDVYEEVYADRPLGAVPSLDLVPRGSTAMLDAIGRLINSAGARLAALPEDARPATVIVGIMTDGMENASQEFSRAQVRQMITTQSKDYDWTFLYMGANQDAVEVGTDMGIDPRLAVTYAPRSADRAMAATSKNISGLRQARAAGASSAAAREAAYYTDVQRAESLGPEVGGGADPGAAGPGSAGSGAADASAPGPGGPAAGPSPRIRRPRIITPRHR
jgi:hypothetical protein